MDPKLDQFAFSFPTGAAIGHTLYPGACLDPNFGVNSRVWLAAGMIDTITILSPENAQDVVIQAYNTADATGRAVKLAASPFYRFCVLDASATAQRSGYGDPILGFVAGTPYYNPSSNGALPATIVNNGRRFFMSARMDETVQVSRPFEFKAKIECPYGMAIRFIGPNLASNPVRVGISFRLDKSGAQRFGEQRFSANSASALIPN